MLELRNICKIYKSKKSSETVALKNINLKFDENGLVFILGKSGCGKSTLLNLIGGLDKNDSGDIIVDDVKINHLNKTKINNYRNSYVGFVFQDYNLLEELNVSQNINLVLELQEKNDNGQVDEVLKSVGLENLKNRKINELSGGQKQRVAIARALIKKPKLLLCDEPTGNLDSESSKQIFDILKDISKTTLVVVVTHDEESATKYSDRIIRIKDGEIVDDTKPNIINQESNKIELAKSHLPFGFKLSFAIDSLFSKKVRLFISCLLLITSLCLFGSVISIDKYSKKEINNKMIETYNKLKKTYNDEFVVNNVWVNDYSKYFSYLDYTLQKTDIDPLTLFPSIISDETKDNVEKVTNRKWNYEYKIQQDGEFLKISYPNNEIRTNIYYSDSDFVPSFVEIIDKDTTIGSEIIGRLPNNYNEIVISNYVADSMINGGVQLSDGTTYLPSDYNDILNSNKTIKFGNTDLELVIVGIVNYNLDEFQKLKQYNTFDEEINDLFEELDYIKENILYRIFVAKNFINNLDLPNNNILKSATLQYSYMNHASSFDAVGYVTPDMNIYYLNTDEDKKDLSNNEVVINLEILNSITGGDFKRKYNEFFYSNESIDKDELIGFIKKYINNSNVLNNSIKINFNSNRFTFSKDDLSEYTITGIDLNVNNTIKVIYLSHDNVDDSIIPYSSSTQIYTIINDSSTLKELLNVVNVDNDYTIARTSFSFGVINAYCTSNIISKIFLYIFIFSLIMNTLILTSLISNSINNKKKQIGILKSLGTTDKDLLHIFSIESIIVLITSIVLSIFGINFINALLNKFFSQELNIGFGIFNFNLMKFSMIVLLNLLITIFTCILVMKKITKLKPIESINNTH